MDHVLRILRSMLDDSRADAGEVSSHPAFSFPSILRTIWKRKVRITLVGVLVTGCALAIVRMLPAVYLSEALILIDSQKIPEKFVSSTVASDLEDRIAISRKRFSR